MTLDDLDDKIDPVPRFDDNELPTDFSSVKSYLTCPFMYRLQNIYGYNAAVPELFGFGQTTHTILERLHQKYKNKLSCNLIYNSIITFFSHLYKYFYYNF